MAHQSGSGTQLRAEQLILDKLKDQLDADLEPRSLQLPGGSRVDVDGVSADESVFIEIFARQGKLKGGQRRKVAQDALKLITLARSRPNARCIIAFGDTEAEQCVAGDSWRRRLFEHGASKLSLSTLTTQFAMA
jgi:hypothetical protein